MSTVAGAQSSAPVIEMRQVAAGALSDPDTLVAEQVDWNVAAGDYWLIGGLQGTGKSDFLMTTGGLMPPASGSYCLFGEPMPIFEDSRLHHRLRMGLVFDGGQLFNHLTVFENIALPLRYRRNLTRARAEAEVLELLNALDLDPWADSTPGALARPWQKRVGLARALALRPELLLLDSPLTGLDLRHTMWWLSFLDQLCKGHPLFQSRPVTLVVTAADLRPWKGRARQFAIMKDKRLLVLGEWAQLEKASVDLTRELLTTELG